MRKILGVLSKIVLLQAVTVPCFAYGPMRAPKPFYVGDMSPLTMNYGAPRSAMPAYLNAGVWQVQVGLEWANSVHKETNNEEYLFVDAETRRLTTAIEYGITPDWDIRLEIPWVQHGKGLLDHPINEYHQLLGFKEGYRPNVSNDQYQVQYRAQGKRLLSVTEPYTGLGDLALSAVRAVNSTYEDTLSYGIQLKLPTGDESHLTGSGTTDVAIWASGANKISPKTRHFMSLGLVYTGKDKGLMAGVRQRQFGFLNYGIEHYILPTLALKAQLDARSAIYKTDTKLLGDSVSLSVGGTKYIGTNTEVDFVLTEDVMVESSVDVSFHMNARVRFDR